MTEPATATPPRPSALAGLLGLLWPGLGLGLRGELPAALLACWAVLSCTALTICDLAAFASRGDLPDSALAAAQQALQRGVVPPQSAWMLVLALTLHLGSAWSAWKGGPEASRAEPVER